MKKLIKFLFVGILLFAACSAFAQTSTVTIYYSGAQAWGCCNACGTDYMCFGIICGCCQSSQQSKTFMDPVPFGNRITSVTVIYYGADCGTPNIATSINGIAICPALLAPGFNTSCACGACNQIRCSAAFPCGLPGYHYGGSNSLFAQPDSGFQVCLQRVMIMFTYTPSGLMTVAGPGTICQGDSAAFSVNPAGNYNSYSWIVPLGSSIISGQGSTSINIIAGNSSGYVCINAIDSCGDSALSCLPIVVKPKPAVASTPSFFNLCKRDSIQLMACGADTYSWSPATGLSATNLCCVMASPSDTTVYTVVGTTDGCTASDQSVIYVIDCSGIPEADLNDAGVKIFPNPVNKAGTISWKGEFDELQIIDNTGRSLQSIVVRGMKSYSISSGHLSEGIYYIGLKHSNGFVRYIKMAVKR